MFGITIVMMIIIIVIIIIIIIIIVIIIVHSPPRGRGSHPQAVLQTSTEGAAVGLFRMLADIARPTAERHFFCLDIVYHSIV